MKELIDPKIYFCLRAKNSILRNPGNKFFILNCKNEKSIKYYFELGDITIFTCKSNIYNDVSLILEKLGLPAITKDEWALIVKKMKDHEKNFGMWDRALPTCQLDFEFRYIIKDLDWN
mgnify:CR=1 FL=1